MPDPELTHKYAAQLDDIARNLTIGAVAARDEGRRELSDLLMAFAIKLLRYINEHSPAPENADDA